MNNEWAVVIASEPEDEKKMINKKIGRENKLATFSI